MQYSERYEAGDACSLSNPLSTLSPPTPHNCTTTNISGCIDWLSALSAPERDALEDTNEFHEFLRCFERLARVHRNLPHVRSSSASTTTAVEESPYTRTLSDDVWIKVLDFLPCLSLVQAHATCRRMRHLARQVATTHVQSLVRHRQLSNVFQLLQAKEQICGVDAGSAAFLHDSTLAPYSRCVVPIPILGLPRRLLVTDCGDGDFNGIYHCTGCNGNGYVFTKPRWLLHGARVTEDWPVPTCPDEAFPEDDAEDDDAGNVLELREEARVDGYVGQRRHRHKSQMFRCFISKRFSNERLLWYMSKELAVVDPNQEIEELLHEDSLEWLERPMVTQVFCYWADLPVEGEEGDASTDLSRYPPATSTLMGGRRHGDDAAVGWQSLPSMERFRPPTVELLDG